MLTVKNTVLDCLIERLANLAGLEENADFRQVYIDIALWLVQLRRSGARLHTA